MSILSSVGDITRGVAEELKADLQDVAWAVLHVLGLNHIFQSLLEEFHFNEHSDTDYNKRRRKKRNLIRIIGSAIPLKPVQRPYFRYVALGSLSTSCDSLFSLTTHGHQIHVESGWGSKYAEKTLPQSPPSLRKCSTFNTSCSSLVNQDASVKIAALEEELAALREQIASIICKAPERPLTPPSTPTPVIPPPPPPPPPPAPPRPAPPFSQYRGASPIVSRKSFSELIHENKASINQHKEPIEVPPSQHSGEGVSMAEVLKGLNKVKLKRVDRSPGGTPRRERPLSPPPLDAASLITAALKKRFANFHVNSPEKDQDSASGFSSPEGSPNYRRRSRRDQFSPEKQSPPSIPQPFVLKKIPKLNEFQRDKPVLPPFGQHLLKRRVKSPPPNRDSPSPSSENSDLSR